MRTSTWTCWALLFGLWLSSCSLVVDPPAASPPGEGEGEGTLPGEGEGEGEGTLPGEGEGEKTPPGEGEGEGTPPGEGEGEGTPPGEGEGEGEGAEPFDPQLTATFQQLLEEFLLFTGEPGVALAVQQGERRWAGAAGLARRSPQELRLTPDALFRLGSNTKPYIAALVLRLAEEGLLSLDDPLAVRLPAYPQWGEVTLRELLSMRSGIPDYLLQPSLWQALLERPGLPVTPAELLRHVPAEPDPSPDGAYSDTNYLLLGLVIEEVTGHPVEQELRTRILDPLGLDHTDLAQGDPTEPELATGYLDLGQAVPLLQLPVDLLDELPGDYQVQGLLVDPTGLLHPSVTWTAGAMVASAADASRFFRALLRGELLQEESLAAMRQFQSITLLGAPASYGLGLMEFPISNSLKVQGHTGISFGYQAGVYHQLEADLTVSYLLNRFPSQWSYFQQQITEVAYHGVEEAPPPCTPPNGFFGALADGTLQLRFRGVVGEEQSPQLPPGLAHAEARLDGAVTSCSGLSATVKQTHNGRRLELTTLGGIATATTKELLHVAVLSLGEDLVARLTDRPTEALDGVITVGEVYYNAASLEPTKICIVGMRSPLEPFQLAACGQPSAALGSQLRVFASVPLVTNPALIRTYLLGRDPCQCFDANSSAWNDCPDR